MADVRSVAAASEGTVEGGIGTAVPGFQLSLAAVAEICDSDAALLRGGKQSLLRLLSSSQDLCCPGCPSSCPLSTSAFHILFPCLHSLQLAFRFFFFFCFLFSFFFPFNGRKASPPNLIPAPLSQADVTSTSVRLLDLPAPAPSRCCRRGSSEGEKKKSKAQIPLLAAA